MKMQDYLITIFYYYNFIVLIYFIVINMVYLLLNFLSFFEIRKYVRRNRVTNPEIMFRSNFYLPVSLIVPAFNEAGVIVENIKSILQLRYPEFEVVVVNDGSLDGTLESIKLAYKMTEVSFEAGGNIQTKPIKNIYISTIYKNLILIDKENGGKADALNAGINYSKYTLFCGLDADSILENDSLLKIARPFVEDPDIIAVGGIVRVINGCTIKNGEVIDIALPGSALARFQIVEYLRAFLFGRTGWSVLNAMLIISGAFGLFRKKEVLAAGGYRADTVGEDMELIVRLHNRFGPSGRSKIRFIPDPVCYTEVPENLSVLARQRNRWQRGLVDSLLMNINMLLNPRYGAVGLFAMPFFFFFEMLGPIVEFTGYFVFLFLLCVNAVSYEIALLFFTAAFVLGMVLSLSSIVLEELSFKKYPGVRNVVILSIYAVLENFGYRQLSTYFRFKGLMEYFLGNKKWGEMKRSGFKKN